MVEQEPTKITNKEEAIGWLNELDKSAPRVADDAPDFVLADVTGEERIRLSDFRGKRPVALVFGSFT